jgi:hypothetical protein
MLTAYQKRVLSQIYYNQTGGGGGTFAGPTTLLKVARQKSILSQVKIVDIYRFLKSQAVYSKFKQAHTRHKRAAVLATSLNRDLQIDIFFWRNRIVLAAVELLSRKTFAYQIGSKSSKNIVNALQKIFDEGGFIPFRIESDAEKGFVLKKFYSKHKIQHIILKKLPQKAQMVEMRINHIKSILERYRTIFNMNNFARVLKRVLHTINSRTLKSLGGLSPDQVTVKNSSQVFKIQHNLAISKQQKSPTIKDGTKVRIILKKINFEKKSTQSFSDEIFVVDRAIKKPPVFTYKLRKLGAPRGKKLIQNTYYASELSICS